MVLFICKNDSELFRSIGLTCHTRTLFNEILRGNRCQAWLNKLDLLLDWLSTFWPLINIKKLQNIGLEIEPYSRKSRAYQQPWRS